MGAVERVRERLEESGLGLEIVHLDKDTRTAELAAQALGTEVGAIVKSLVFDAEGEVVLALVAGDRRADAEKIARHAGRKQAAIMRASEVKARTGYAIGGVPPVITDEQGRQVQTLMDPGLFRYETIYAAAGSPFDIFPVAPDALVRLTSATVADITVE
jgi:Cys-tRNA(Pro) deacylase